MDWPKEIPEQVIINVGEADDNSEILKLNLHSGFTYICVCTHTSLTEDIERSEIHRIAATQSTPILMKTKYPSSLASPLSGHMKLKKISI